MGNLTSQGNGNRTDYLREFFIMRLEHMVAVRRERGPELGAGSTDLRLLDKAVYSTFCDCLDLGLAGEAKAILRRGEGKKAPKVGSEQGQN